MPTVTEQNVTGLAFCIDGRCPGYNQQPVLAVKRTSEFSFVENGGDLPGIERSTSQVFFADEADAVCQHCGKPRLVEDHERPEYPNTSGRDPMEIFHFQGQAANTMREMMLAQENEKLRHEAEVSELRSQMAAQGALMERMAAQLDELSVARRPGRPARKETE